MKKSVELKQQRTAKVEAQQAIVDTAKAEKRDFNATEEEAFDGLTAEIRVFTSKIERAEQVEANELLLAQRNATPVTPAVSKGEEVEKEKVFRNVDIFKAMREAAPGGAGLSGAEKEMHEIGLAENRAANVSNMGSTKTHLSIPLSYLGRATQQTVTQDDGEYGGALVHNQAPRIVAPLRPVLPFEALGATFMTNLSGGNIPLLVPGDYDMEWLAEGAAITPQKKKIGGPLLSPKRAGGAVDISNQLIMQSSTDVQALIMNGLKNGFARLLNSAVLNGPGGVAPLGILNYPGVNVADATASTLPTWAQIVELQGLIEENDSTEDSLGYIIHPRIKSLLKQVVKDAGSGRFLLEDKTIDGIPFISTSLMPKLTDGAAKDVYPIIYGDFAQLFIGQWGSLNISINPYSADLSDSLRLVLNTYADVQIAQPKAFAKNAFIGLE